MKNKLSCSLLYYKSEYKVLIFVIVFPGGSVLKNLPANAGDAGSIPGMGRSPGEGNGNPLQYSCLENPLLQLFTSVDGMLDEHRIVGK